MTVSDGVSPSPKGGGAARALSKSATGLSICKFVAVCIVCSEMGVLKRCQAAVLQSSCGSSASTVLNQLFDIALRDPFYLRFGYRPDCGLHGAETAAPSPSQAPSLPQIDTAPVPNVHSLSPRTENSAVVELSLSGRSAVGRHRGASLVMLVVASLLTVAVV